MATWEDVRRIANSLPEVSEEDMRGALAWRVNKTLFVWERPLRRSDLEALGDAAPDGPIPTDADVYFTIPHFDGYPAILVLLDKIARAELEELIVEAWLSRAPKRLVKQWESTNGSAE